MSTSVASLGSMIVLEWFGVVETLAFIVSDRGAVVTVSSIWWLDILARQSHYHHLGRHRCLRLLIHRRFLVLTGCSAAGGGGPKRWHCEHWCGTSGVNVMNMTPSPLEHSMRVARRASVMVIDGLFPLARTNAALRM